MPAPSRLLQKATVGRLRRESKPWRPPNPNQRVSFSYSPVREACAGMMVLRAHQIQLFRCCNAKPTWWTTPYSSMPPQAFTAAANGRMAASICSADLLGGLLKAESGSRSEGSSFIQMQEHSAASCSLVGCDFGPNVKIGRGSVQWASNISSPVRLASTGSDSREQAPTTTALRTISSRRSVI